MSGNGRLALPGQVAIGFQMQPAPTAHPSTLVLQGGGGAQVFHIGGYTKLEDAALRMVPVALRKLAAEGSLLDDGLIIEEAISLAVRTLKAASEYKEPEAEPTP